MKTKAFSSFFVLFAIAVGMLTMAPAAFADHTEVTIVPAEGSGVQGCQETEEGCYIPGKATVDVGGKVIFSNTDSFAHTITSGDPFDKNNPVGEMFDSGLVNVGKSYNWTPTKVGEYPYFCIVHPWMTGMITVQEAEAKTDAHDDEPDGTIMPDGDEVMAMGMLSDGTEVSIRTSIPTAGEMMEISIEYAGMEHVNHDVMATQNGESILLDEGAHHHDGMGMHTTQALSSSDPVDITITFQGYGNVPPEERKGPMGEQVVFTNIVPEFGTIAMMILAVAIISIVAVTAKSRVVPRF